MTRSHNGGWQRSDCCCSARSLRAWYSILYIKNRSLYNSPFEIQRTERFNKWLKGLADKKGKALISDRIERLAQGHLGDAKVVGNGVTELRVHFGPGYRVYITQRGATLIVLLCGGEKRSQVRDIERAIVMARKLEK
jgi:putative addiction module killer protein